MNNRGCDILEIKEVKALNLIEFINKFKKPKMII